MTDKKTFPISSDEIPGFIIPSSERRLSNHPGLAWTRQQMRHNVSGESLAAINAWLQKQLDDTITA